MSTSAKQILTILKEAKSLGLTKIKIDGLEAEFTHEPEKTPSPPVPDVKADEIYQEISKLDQLTDREILFYSTDYYDELQAEKEHRKQQLKEAQDG